MSQLTVRIDDDLKTRLQNLARQEDRSVSEVVRSLVRGYVQDRDRSAALRKLWDRMEENARAAGARPDDVAGAIETVRERSSEENRSFQEKGR